MSRSILPLEMLACVFSHLPIHDLTTVSLLCRTWRDIAFPHLYKTVHISRTSHLASLASRVVLHNAHSPRSIAAHLKRFRIDNLRNFQFKHPPPESEILDNKGLVHLEILVPRLSKLKYLEWDIWFAYDAKYLQLFQTHCRSLKGAEFLMANSRLAKSDQFTLYFDFFNLSHIFINFPGIIKNFPKSDSNFAYHWSKAFTSATHDIEYVSPLTQLLTACPGLVSLTLVNMDKDPISVVNIVSSLGNTFVFPSLLVFRIDWIAEEIEPVGDNLHWNDFFTEPRRNSHPLRLFFLRHKRIEDLALGWSSGMSYEGRIDPSEIALLFPSLKHFEGPAFLCNAITKFDIAQNLEALTTVDSHTSETDWLDAMGGELRSMPKLRSLEIRAHLPDTFLDPLVLNDFILAAPGIETLECRLKVRNFTAVLIAISHAPKLRELAVDGKSWMVSALGHEYNRRAPQESEASIISCVAKRCHSLESYRDVRCWNIWKVVRDERGNYQGVHD